MTGKIDFKKLKHRTFTGKDGIEYIAFPIKGNHFFEGKTGLYMDISTFTHQDKELIKQNIPKEVYNKMSEEERRALPILGELKQWGGTEQTTTPAPVVTDTDPDDLPF